MFFSFLQHCTNDLLKEPGKKLDITLQVIRFALACFSLFLASFRFQAFFLIHNAPAILFRYCEMT